MSKLIAQAPPNAANFGSQGIQPAGPAFVNSTVEPQQQLEDLISTGLGIITVVAGLFFVVYFFLAAVKWMTAGGDAGQIQKARDEMVQGVIGLIIIVAAYGLIGLLSTVLGLDILNPAAQIDQIIGRLGVS